MDIAASDDAWLIIIMFTPAFARAVNARAATPGVPIMPAPERLRRATFFDTVTAFMTSSFWKSSCTIWVPGLEGSNVHFTLTGTPFLIAGSIALGWRTLGSEVGELHSLPV